MKKFLLVMFLSIISFFSFNIRGLCATNEISIHRYDFDDFSFTFNNITYTSDSIKTMINNHLHQFNLDLNISFRYISIAVPNSPVISTGQANGYIYIDVLGRRFNEVLDLISTDTAFGGYRFSPSLSSSGKFRIRLSDGSFIDDGGGSTTDLSSIRNGNSSNYFNVYTNFNFDTLRYINDGRYNLYGNLYLDYSMYDMLPNLQPIIVDFLQGDVIIQNSSNSIGNLLTFYFSGFPNTLNNSLDLLNYRFELYDSYVSNPIVFVPDILDSPRILNSYVYRYSYNYLMTYNNIINLKVYYLDTLIYERDFNAYYKDFTSFDFVSYDFNNFAICDISDVSIGAFGVSKILEGNYNIYVYDATDNSYVDFLTSNYFVDTYEENNINFYRFDFQNNSNLYLKITNSTNFSDDMKNFIVDKYYVYAPRSAYVHMSDLPPNENFRDLEVNKSCYKINGVVNCVNNPISIDNNNLSGFSFFGHLSNFTNSFKNVWEFFGSFLTNFLNNIPTQLLSALYFSFALVVLAILIRIWL